MGTVERNPNPFMAGITTPVQPPGPRGGWMNPPFPGTAPVPSLGPPFPQPAPNPFMRGFGTAAPTQAPQDVVYGRGGPGWGRPGGPGFVQQAPEYDVAPGLKEAYERGQMAPAFPQPAPPPRQAEMIGPPQRGNDQLPPLARGSRLDPTTLKRPNPFLRGGARASLNPFR